MGHENSGRNATKTTADLPNRQKRELKRVLRTRIVCLLVLPIYPSGLSSAMAVVKRARNDGPNRGQKSRIAIISFISLAIAALTFLSSPSNLRSLYTVDSMYYVRSMEMLEARVKSGLPLSTIERYQYRTASWPQSDEESAKARELCGKGPDYPQWFQQNVEHRSEHDEDRLIYESFFKWLGDEVTKRDYIYVELGAFDGLRASNSRFFDVCLGWQGVLVEANPMIYPQLKRNRLNAHRMSFAASCPELDMHNNATVDYYKVRWSNAGQVPGVESIYHSIPATRRARVPCGSLTPILSTLFPGRRIPFMSIDVSGAEHLVLENFDFEAVPVDIVLVKWYHPSYCQEDCDKRHLIHRAMTSKVPYRKAFTGFAKKYDLYLHPSSPFRSLLRR